MLETLKKCQYPNLAAEIHSHHYHYDSFARHGNITSELLNAFLQGDEEITLSEALGMAKLTNSLQSVTLHMEYLLSQKLGFYDMTKEKHRRKVLLNLKRCDYLRQTTDIPTLFKQRRLRYREDYINNRLLTASEAGEHRYICRSAINRVIRFIKDVELALTETETPPRGINK
jgi:hypothetical protein